MEKRRLSPDDLEAQLLDQLGVLQRSAQHFDEGYQLEARRMAVTLRVLLHSGRDPSLLKQLGRSEIDFVDTSPPFLPENLLTFQGLVSMEVRNGEISYRPRLDTTAPLARKAFSEWWSSVIFVDKQSRKMSRSDIVRTAADQDGGAHVDAALRADYFELRRENSLGWLTDKGVPPLGDPCFASIRQIVHEVLKTLIPFYSNSNSDVLAARKRAEISGRKMRFFPHETQFFKNETAAPLVPNFKYLAEIVVDRITTGSVMVVVNSAVTDPIRSIGMHRSIVVAGLEQNSGVFGEYTDAVIDRVSIRQVLE